VGHLPGPYTIPNVKADVFCVYTNRTPATAMRGFGVTGVDYALECHADKMARLINMDPIEFRILNAYRDGDMKAHRREAKNCALVECCQVAAEKANWPIGEQFKQMTSMQGGGGERGAIPQTALDQEGLIGSPGSAPTYTPSYASPVSTPAAPIQPAPVPAMAPAAAPPPSAPASAPSPTVAPAAPAAPAAPPTKRQGGIRFSSISGTRRR
jgi:hypothetical protein